jgi:peptidoglycan/LPS O-acetylase OafA/YrhL
MTIRPRLYLLDTFRGLASLSVVIWHYQHFYYTNQGTLGPDFSLELQPFYDPLRWFYRYGNEAVQLFFAISGFIFFLTSYETIAARKMTAWRFAALRFSRLYPLHLAILLFVAIAQYLSRQIDGHSIVYQINDGWHFLAQLFFASNWGFQSGQSFNGPIWSVSVEIILYAMFFVLSYFLGSVTRNTFIAVLAMFCLSGTFRLFSGSDFLSNPAACFFAGGISYAIWNTVRLSPMGTKKIVAGTAAIVCAASLWAFANVEPMSNILYFIAYPSSIVVLALLQDMAPKWGRSTRVIGDITYATYLIHFPIQLVILLTAKYFGLMIDFNSPVTFLLFFGTVILVSIPIYHYFELPMQQMCRRRLLGDPVALKDGGDAPLFCRRRSWTSRKADDRRLTHGPAIPQAPNT